MSGKRSRADSREAERYFCTTCSNNIKLNLKTFHFGFPRVCIFFFPSDEAFSLITSRSGNFQRGKAGCGGRNRGERERTRESNLSPSFLPPKRV